MAMWSQSTLAGAEDAIEAFGRRLREGRRRAFMTQMRLEERSGVDQSLISRLELARAPHASLERIIRLGQALGDNFPLGYCPHEHRCPYRLDWQPPPWEGHLPYQQRPELDHGENATPNTEIVNDLDPPLGDDGVADDDFAIDISLSDIRADAWKGVI